VTNVSGNTCAKVEKLPSKLCEWGLSRRVDKSGNQDSFESFKPFKTLTHTGSGRKMAKRCDLLSARNLCFVTSKSKSCRYESVITREKMVVSIDA
jgi:hypothetical protein